MPVTTHFLKETKTMDERCNLKLQKLILTQKDHADRLLKIESSLKDISQIKWLLIGGMAFFVFDKIGFIKTIGLIFS